MEVHDRMMDYEELMDIVENNDKKRFEIKKADFGDNGYDDLIRATLYCEMFHSKSGNIGDIHWHCKKCDLFFLKLPSHRDVGPK